jgi:hypothetical protein
MRTTLTLEPDVAEQLKLRVTREKISLKRAVNEALRAGLAGRRPPARVRFKVEPHPGGLKPGIDPSKLNQLLDELEVEEFRGKLAR